MNDPLALAAKANEVADRVDAKFPGNRIADYLRSSAEAGDVAEIKRNLHLARSVAGVR